MRTLVYAVSLTLNASLPIGVLGQDLTFVVPGDLVRAARVEPRRMPSWIVGRVVDASGDSLTLASIEHSPSTFALSWEWITQLQVSRGRKAKTVTGLAAGLLLGIPVGATAGWIRDTRVNDLTTRESTQRGLRIGAVAGLLLGGVIGTLVHVERWEDVSVTAVSR